MTAAVFATACFGIAALAWPGGRALLLDLYLLAIGSLAILTVVSRTIGAEPRERATRLDRRRQGARPDPRPRGLLKLEREVALSSETAFDAYFRLRPHVRTIAAARLGTRGIDLDGGDRSAEALVGPEAWALADPDLPRPRRHDAAGPSLVEIDAAVSALERL